MKSTNDLDGKIARTRSNTLLATPRPRRQTSRSPTRSHNSSSSGISGNKNYDTESANNLLSRNESETTVISGNIMQLDKLVYNNPIFFLNYVPPILNLV